MKKKLIGKLLAGVMIMAMALGLTACGQEQTTVAETPAVTAAAPVAEKPAETAAKETPAEPEKETETSATEKETEKAAETEAATEEAKETENGDTVTDGSPLVGEWSAMEMFVFKFFEDGTGDYVIAGSSMPFTYEDHGDSVFVKFDEDSDGEEHGYRIDGDTLYFEDSMGEEVEYKR